MNRLLLVVLALGSVAASASVRADSQEGGYFLSVGLGGSVYHSFGRPSIPGYVKKNSSSAGAIRFGYQWNNAAHLGIETGYVNLGQMNSRYSLGDYSLNEKLRASGWMLGLNSAFRFDSPWYVSVRGGLLRSLQESRYSYQNLPYGPAYGSSGYGSDSGTGAGWYAGLGVGYDLTERSSVGAQYDNYHLRATIDGASSDGNVSAFTIQFEYHF